MELMERIWESMVMFYGWRMREDGLCSMDGDWRMGRKEDRLCSTDGEWGE